MSERLAGMPRTWGRNPTAVSRIRRPGATFWTLTVVLVVATVYGVVNVGAMFGSVASLGLALVLWGLWLVVAAWLFGLVDVYRHVPWSMSLVMLAWGAFVATPVAGLLEGLVPPFLGAGYTTAVTAGLFEETLKLLGVIVAVALVPVLFRRFMGVLICALMTGVGFSFYENVGYTATALAGLGAGADATQNVVSVVETFLIRGFVSQAAAHMAFTGLACMGVFYFLSRSGQSLGRRWAVAIAFLLAAALLHFLNDAPLSSNPLGQLLNSGAQIAVLVWLIVRAVRAERRWLADTAEQAEPVIAPSEARALRTHRTRRQARASVSDNGARQRMKTMQWAQLGYIHAVSEGAPGTQTERLASYTAILRSPTGAGKIPDPRRPEPSDERHPTSETPPG